MFSLIWRGLKISLIIVALLLLVQWLGRFVGLKFRLVETILRELEQALKQLVHWIGN